MSKLTRGSLRRIELPPNEEGEVDWIEGPERLTAGFFEDIGLAFQKLGLPVDVGPESLSNIAASRIAIQHWAEGWSFTDEDGKPLLISQEAVRLLSLEQIGHVSNEIMAAAKFRTPEQERNLARRRRGTSGSPGKSRRRKTPK